MEQAYLALRTAKARAKHVVLLSDGRSYPDDYEGARQEDGGRPHHRLDRRRRAVGRSGAAGNIAKWGKGRAYQVADAKELPQIFVEGSEERGDAGRSTRKQITADRQDAGVSDRRRSQHIPPLKGRTATVLKDTALELLATDDDDPLLAFWPIGLGRTAVFASDVKDRWAADWVTWRGYGPFFAAVARALERRRAAGSRARGRARADPWHGAVCGRVT